MVSHVEMCRLMLAEAHALERGRLCEGDEQGRAESARDIEAARLRRDVARMRDRNAALCLAGLIWTFARLRVTAKLVVPLRTWFTGDGPFSTETLTKLDEIARRYPPLPSPEPPWQPSWQRRQGGPPVIIEFPGDGSTTTFTLGEGPPGPIVFGGPVRPEDIAKLPDENFLGHKKSRR